MNPTDQPLAESSRLPLRPPPYAPDLEKYIHNNALTGLSPQNLRLALAHQPQLAAAFQALAHVILFKCELPEREREIAIIRTGALTRSEYEWGMHVSIFGEKCGLGPQHVSDLTSCASWDELNDTLWTGDEKLVVRAVDELHQHSTVTDTTWERLRAHWSNAQLVELILSAGFYHMAAFFLNSMAVPLETGSARFPEGL